MEKVLRDFLYIDHKRVYDQVSQFVGSLKTSASVEEGHHDSQSITSSDMDASSVSSMQSNEGDIKPGKEASTTMSNMAEIRKSLSEKASYDFSQNHKITLLSLLEDSKLIKTEQDDLSVGNWVHISTNVKIFDTEMILSPLRLLVKILPLILNESSTPTETKKNRPTNQKVLENPQKKSIAQLESSIDEIVKALPTQIHFNAIVPNTKFEVQGVINEEMLQEARNSLTLRHGVNLSGEWNILGIIDSVPHSGDNEEMGSILSDMLKLSTNKPDGSFSNEHLLYIHKLISEIGQLSGSILEMWVQMVRSLVGHKKDAYYLTPVLIYREVGKIE